MNLGYTYADTVQGMTSKDESKQLKSEYQQACLRLSEAHTAVLASNMLERTGIPGTTLRAKCKCLYDYITVLESIARTKKIDLR